MTYTIFGTATEAGSNGLVSEEIVATQAEIGPAVVRAIAAPGVMWVEVFQETFLPHPFQLMKDIEASARGEHHADR